MIVHKDNIDEVARKAFPDNALRQLQQKLWTRFDISQHVISSAMLNLRTGNKYVYTLDSNNPEINIVLAEY